MTPMKNTIDYGITDIQHVGDHDTEAYQKADENLDQLLDEWENRLERYEKRGDAWEFEQKRMKALLNADKIIQLASEGGLFIEFKITDDFQRREKQPYRFFTSSEIPKHLEIHNVKVNVYDMKVKIQLSDRS